MAIRRSRLVVVLVASLLLIAACGSGSGKSSAEAAADGSKDGPPAFKAASLAGGEIDSASFAGKPTALWFWAPWCTVCRAEAPDVAKVAKEMAGKVEIVGVAGRGEVPAMKEFVNQTGTDGFTHVVDADGSIWSSYGVAAQPAFAFIDANGKVDVSLGALSHDALTKRLQALAAT